MTSRERFNNLLHGRAVDHVTDFEFWFWDTTLERWAAEGLPDHLVPTRRGSMEGHREDLCAYFGFELIHGVPIKTRFIRSPREEVVAETAETETIRTELGEELVRFKPGHGESIPTHITYAIKTREDWERVRDEFLPLALDQRMPANWNQLVAEYRTRDFILNTPQMGYYGFLRNLMGVEELSVAIALEPEWVEEMMEHMHQIHLAVIRRLVQEVQCDISGWWEDMCYSSGPLISPAMFDHFMVPRYKAITDLMREHGCDRAVVDSDGNLHALAPLWYKAGVNCLLPCEAAHTDTMRLRRENAPDVWLWGGIDKKQFARGRAAIDAELERIKPLLALGHYIPHADHLVPPDVSLADYMYYRERKMKLLGK